MLLLEKFAEFMSHSQYGSDRVGRNAPINGFPQSCDHCVYRAQVDFGTTPHYLAICSRVKIRPGLEMRRSRTAKGLGLRARSRPNLRTHSRPRIDL